MTPRSLPRIFTRPTSLRGRVTYSGLAVMTVLVLALDVFVFLSLRGRMESELDRVLEARAQLVQGLAAELDPDQLSVRLEDLGVRAIVRPPEGRELRSAGAPPLSGILPSADPEGSITFRAVPLEGGGEVLVLASRAGIEDTLERLLLLETVGTPAVVALAYLILARTSARVLRPVRDVARTARSIAEGRLHRRLVSHGDEDELADMVAAFNRMLDALEEALTRSQASEETSRRFLADAAHQLRTPTAGIRASVATMLRSDDPDEREHMMDHLARESARMSRLLSSLLWVARLDRGEPPSRQPVSLTELAEECVARQRTLAPHLGFTVDADGDATTTGDPDSLREAVDNVIDNARRHADRTVTVRLARHGPDHEVAVLDDGPGVAPEDRERIFERFVSLDPGDGSGLGLPIARGVARAHGGDLRCVDGGFLLRLPAVAEGSLRTDPTVRAGPAPA
jgi:two-component system OmpR family sensor kinase